MRILLLNQAFHPDTVSTAQYLTDAALALQRSGHEVTVLTGSRAYDDPSVRFPRRETWNGIRILRVPSIAPGKTRPWRRAVGFSSYLIACTSRLVLLPRFDVIVALTSPPLISWLGALAARFRRSRFVFWVMDLNPDEAVAAGWLRRDSLTARLLQRFLRYSLRAADRVIVLDRFMRDIVVGKSVEAGRVSVLSPWSQDDVVWFDAKGRDRFRREHGLDGRFVVMYAGNHSPCNPLDTLIEAAKHLRGREDVRFCFMGGGSLFRHLESEARAGNLPNAVLVPYQPRERLAGALSGADLHIVTMGDAFVGLIHPSKIYNILRVGCPFLYIGPGQSHVQDVIHEVRGSLRGWSIRHGDVEGTVHAILEAAQSAQPQAAASRTPVKTAAQSAHVPRLVSAIVGHGVTEADGVAVSTIAGESPDRS